MTDDSTDDPLRHLTPEQRHARLLQEVAMRAGKLRRPPTVFAELDENDDPPPPATS